MNFDNQVKSVNWGGGQTPCEGGCEMKMNWWKRGVGFLPVLVLLLGMVTASSAMAGQGSFLYVFNMGSEDVTVIDTSLNQVLGSKSLGVKVKWLSNEQPFFDGKLIWTYTVRKDKSEATKKVDVLAIDPATMQVVRKVEVGKGPAHSVAVIPGKPLAIVNVAGDDVLAYVDSRSMEVIDRIPVGKFPCDLDLSPDARWAYFPERDQDTVAMIDVATKQVVKRVSFPKGTKPHMLRVSPDGKYIWVQTAKGNTNEVLDAQTLEILNAQPTGKVPLTNAWTPDGRLVYITHAKDNVVLVMEAAPPFRQLKRIEVGPSPRNIAFRPDGRYAYVTVSGLNAVAVIDTATLKVETMLPVGRQPSALITLDIRPEL